MKRCFGPALAQLLLHLAVSSTALPQAAEQDAFLLVMGRDTFAVENFSRTADRLEGELTGRALGRLVYRASFGATATISELTLQAWTPGVAPETAPGQDARLAVQGDSVIAEITTPAGSRTQRIGSEPGALLYVNPSFALMEQVLLRARAVGGTRVEVPLFLVQGGQTLAATVTWTAADSVTLSLAGSEMHGVVDAVGRLVNVTVPAQGLTVTRVLGVHLPPAAFEPPDYSAPEGAPYTAEDVAVKTRTGHVLAGTLTRPLTQEAVPAVVMITGSGAQDRDQALPMIRGYRPFREVADTLSRRGIAVLRLDDRGFGASTGDFAMATSVDFAEDVRAALEYLRTRPDVDGRRLGLVGHSEGGLIAPMVAATDSLLAGIVVIAGPAQTGRKIIAYQQRYALERSETIPEASVDSALVAARERLEAEAAHQPWLRFFLDYDPLPVARQVRRTPVLILHGETDRQVTPEQADALAAAFRAGGNPDVTVHVLPEVNHLLLRDPDGSPAGYAALEERSVAPEVLGILAEWVVSRLR